MIATAKTSDTMATLAAALVAALLSAGPASAQANGKDGSGNAFSWTLGVRSWFAQWDSWNVGQTATGVAVGDNRYEVVESVRASAKAAAIPVLSLRYGSAFVSASTMTDTRYALRDTATPGGFDVSSSRQERDLNLGYSFASGVNSSLGYKQISQRFGADRYVWKGPVLGFGLGAPLASGWGAYASLGLGQLRATFPAAFPDASGKTRFNADYRLLELGLTHAFVEPLAHVRSLVFTAGYRIQRMGTRDYMLGYTEAGDATRRPNTSGELVDVTAGFAVGLQATF